MHATPEKALAEFSSLGSQGASVHSTAARETPSRSGVSSTGLVSASSTVDPVPAEGVEEGADPVDEDVSSLAEGSDEESLSVSSQDQDEAS